MHFSSNGLLARKGHVENPVIIGAIRSASTFEGLTQPGTQPSSFLGNFLGVGGLWAQKFAMFCWCFFPVFVAPTPWAWGAPGDLVCTVRSWVWCCRKGGGQSRRPGVEQSRTLVGSQKHLYGASVKNGRQNQRALSKNVIWLGEQHGEIRGK